MGQVWRARHQLLMRPCAVKLIKLELLGESNRESAIARFRLEAKAIARLSSPNTVRLYDFGVSESGAFYFVMELLQGQDLLSLVQRFGPMPPERVVAVLRQACRSLGEAHAAGLLHRDIKPHNLFLCRLGLEYDVLKVLDFGLVKSVREGEANLTTDGALTGTPAYMPPERVIGSPAEERSDLYALGCVAYWMLTGQDVFAEATPMATLLAHVDAKPVPPSARTEVRIPAPLETAIMACLAKSPADRPSAAELDRRLGSCEQCGSWTADSARAWWNVHHLPAVI
jgi:serine/threonine-protein kinase